MRKKYWCLEAVLYTTKHIGTYFLGREIFELLLKYGGIYIPEKYDNCEPVRRAFDPKDISFPLRMWVEEDGPEFGYFLTTRKKPVKVNISMSWERHRNAQFNNINICIEDKYFKKPEKIGEFLNFTKELCQIVRPVYGFITWDIYGYFTVEELIERQEKEGISFMHLTEGLKDIHWANFFGKPYIDFFGKGKLLNVPCWKVEEIGNDIILLLATPSPFSSELLVDNTIIEQLKEYLDNDAFLKKEIIEEIKKKRKECKTTHSISFRIEEEYKEMLKCRVPEFDFSEVREGYEGEEAETKEERLEKTKKWLIDQGHEYIGKTDDGKLIFRTKDGQYIYLTDDTFILDMR